MKTPIHVSSYRNALLAAAACLCVALSAAEQASAAPNRAQSRASAADARLQRGAARLVIHRSPNLGHNVIVRLFIDGVSTASIAYGHTYEHFVPAGPHVVTLLPSPNPKWLIPYNVTLHARRGRTYNLTVIDGGSGQLSVRRR